MRRRARRSTACSSGLRVAGPAAGSGSPLLWSGPRSSWRSAPVASTSARTIHPTWSGAGSRAHCARLRCTRSLRGRARLRAELAEAQRLAREAEAEEERAVEEGADDDEAARRALTLIVTTEEKAVAVDQLISTLWGSGNLRRWQAEEA